MIFCQGFPLRLKTIFYDILLQRSPVVLKINAESIANMRLYSKEKSLFNLGRFTRPKLRCASFGTLSVLLQPPGFEMYSESSILFSFKMLVYWNLSILTVCGMCFPLYISVEHSLVIWMSFCRCEHSKRDKQMYNAQYCFFFRR